MTSGSSRQSTCTTSFDHCSATTSTDSGQLSSGCFDPVIPTSHDPERASPGSRRCTTNGRPTWILAKLLELLRDIEQSSDVGRSDTISAILGWPDSGLNAIEEKL